MPACGLTEQCVRGFHGCVRSGLSGAAFRGLRNCRADSRTLSAIRIFSGQDNARRVFCQRACRSSSAWISLMGEPRLELLPRGGQSMPVREQADFLPGHTSRLQQRQDAGEILRPSDTQGDY